MSEPQAISDLLTKAFKELQMESVANEQQIKEAYNQVVGDLIAKLTWTIRFDGNALYIRLASAALRHELSLRRQSLIDKINEHLEMNAVKNIVFL